MSIYNCFSTIIGLTREEPDCILEWEDDYAISDANLYLDELQGISLRLIDATGFNPDLWTKMLRAKENAITAFKNDVIQEILKYKEHIRSRFAGEIGGRNFTTLTPASTFYGLRMFSDVKGGKFILRGVTLMLNTTEAVNLLIYDEYDLVTVVPLTSVAGRPHTTSFSAVELPLVGNYYFLIQPAGVPYNNKLTCGCGGYRWCFSPDTPCYRYSRDKWTEWAMIAGVSGADVTARDTWATTKNAMGMRLHGNFLCDISDMLCSETSDFLHNEIDIAIAWAILYKAGEYLMNYIMDSGEVNRYTLLGIDALNENRVYYNARYVVMVDFIARTIEDERNECLRCLPPFGMGKRSHLI